jgi:hypothetical protein
VNKSKSGDTAPPTNQPITPPTTPPTAPPTTAPAGGCSAGYHIDDWAAASTPA